MRVSPTISIALPEEFVEEPQTIIVDGGVFLGQLEKNDDGSVSVRNALPLGDISAVLKEHLALYLEAAVVGDLQDSEIGGNASYSKTPLSPNMRMEFQILHLRLRQAGEVAPGNLIKSEFRKAIGG
jgi:hypothetical protein